MFPVNINVCFLHGTRVGGDCGLVIGHSALAAVSPHPIIGSRQGLDLDVPFGGGFVLSFRRFALGVGFGNSAFAAVSSYHIVGLC